MLSPTDQMKQKVAEQALELIDDGMTIGLGSGSTVFWMMKALGERVQKGLRVEGIPTSIKTERLAKEFGIPLTNFSEVQDLDLAIDGANEIDSHLNMIKGGGGSLLREKIVAGSSKQLIIIADESKRVSNLGKFPLPVEITPFGFEKTIREVSKLGCIPVLRKLKDLSTFITDNGNYIVDCQFGIIKEPMMLHKKIKLITGVVETGLFIGMADQLIINSGEKVTILINHEK